MFPRVNVNLKKLSENLDWMSKKVTSNDMSLMIVTKVVCADEEIIELISENESVKYYADSRVENLMKIEALECKKNLSKKKKVLLRLPMISDIERIVRHADISLNSEIMTIRELDREALRQNTEHGVILMIDVGDLREGIYYTDEEKIFDVVEEILNLENIKLEGIGVNLTCYGAVIPHYDNLSIIADYAEKIEKKFGVKLNIISGGNSSSLYLIDKKEIPNKINNLRIGEAFYLANETAYSNRIEGEHDDCFELEAEIIEIKSKRSLPVGDIGVDAFGKKPFYEDQGIIKKAIIAIGKQDIDIDCVVPIDERIEILGASSDHMILNMEKCKNDYSLGDRVKFKLNYGGILKLFTSDYVDRNYIK